MLQLLFVEGGLLDALIFCWFMIYGSKLTLDACFKWFEALTLSKFDLNLKEPSLSIFENEPDGTSSLFALNDYRTFFNALFKDDLL